MTHAIVKRFDTLSDGIIAIIMTILVLEIKLPIGLADLPSFAYAIGTFLISFIIVFNFWFRRTQVVSNVEEIGFTSFMLDMLAHWF
ncbi:TMEM175 family protein [Streptococcus halichoeri]|uniref:TMEM175 family protein n=1 Tax=Streptococcus halichoeri TaxID=254785 RepID=UPI001E3B2B6C|nr:TMEM175 family protein [Streptococcus halichoeri]